MCLYLGIYECTGGISWIEDVSAGRLIEVNTFPQPNLGFLASVVLMRRA